VPNGWEVDERVDMKIPPGFSLTTPGVKKRVRPSGVGALLYTRRLSSFTL